MGGAYYINADDKEYFHAMYGDRDGRTILQGGTTNTLTFKIDTSRSTRVYCKKSSGEIFQIEAAIHSDSTVSNKLFITEETKCIGALGAEVGLLERQRKGANLHRKVLAITMDDLEHSTNNGNAIVLPELGIALGTDLQVVRAAVVRASVCAETSKRLVDTAHHNIYARGLIVVEDDGKKGIGTTYWFKILGHAFHVKTISLSESGLNKTGVYTSGRNGADWTYEGTVKDCLFTHTSDMQREWFLYSNEEDANNLSNLLTATRTQQVQQEKAKLKLVGETEETTHRNTLSLLDKKQELETVSHERDIEKVALTTKTLETKSNYEERSAERKDKSESIISWGKIAAGIAAVAGTTAVIGKQIASVRMTTGLVSGVSLLASIPPLLAITAIGGVAAGIVYGAYKCARWLWNKVW